MDELTKTDHPQPQSLEFFNLSDETQLTILQLLLENNFSTMCSLCPVNKKINEMIKQMLVQVKSIDVLDSEDELQASSGFEAQLLAELKAISNQFNDIV